MKKHIILISNPGEKGDENYCNGVNVDVVNYYKFFLSPLGGAWYNNEITHLDRPTASELELTLSRLRDNEYTKIIFCGHGYYSKRRASTILELKKNEEFDSMMLRGISKKQTIILDCCRKVTNDIFSEQRTEKFAKSLNTLNVSDSRKFYENSIEKCPASIIVTYACDISEEAGDSSSQGGYYSSSLLRACNEIHESSTIDTSKNYNDYSIVCVFNKAVTIVQKLSGNSQNPQIEKQRSEPYFPFAIIA